MPADALAQVINSKSFDMRCRILPEVRDWTVNHISSMLPSHAIDCISAHPRETFK